MTPEEAAIGARRDAEFLDQVLPLLPEQGEWNEADYLWLSSRTNRLVELSDGCIEVLPMPTEKHQAIVAHLFLAFLAVARRTGGKVVFAPFRLRLQTGKFREPDLLFLRSARDQRRQDAYWDGADLVVEVVSSDDPSRDLVTKRAEYAAAGVAEYWIVDAEAELISVLALEEGTYVEHGKFGRGMTVTSTLLPELAVAAGEVFDAS
jgi:Uma2 family endonuclease